MVKETKFYDILGVGRYNTDLYFSNGMSLIISIGGSFGHRS